MPKVEKPGAGDKILFSGHVHGPAWQFQAVKGSRRRHARLSRGAFSAGLPPSAISLHHLYRARAPRSETDGCSMSKNVIKSEERHRGGAASCELGRAGTRIRGAELPSPSCSSCAARRSQQGDGGGVGLSLPRLLLEPGHGWAVGHARVAAHGRCHSPARAEPARGRHPTSASDSRVAVTGTESRH